MFAKRFRDDSWNVIFFESLREEYWKKGKTDIFTLIDKKVLKKIPKVNEDNQLELFSKG